MATRIHQLLTVALALSQFFVVGKCRADPHPRNGVYFQLASGLGWMDYRSTVHYPNGGSPNGEWRDYTNQQNGAGLTGSLLLGFQLRPGLALGAAGLASTYAVSHPNARDGYGGRVTWNDNGGPFLKALGTVGPFVDYYPRAALGWHVQALVGYASLGYGDGDDDRAAPSGIGLMAGVGHDWWVSDRWSIGPLLRLVYASTHVAGTSNPEGGGLPSEHYSVLSPSLEVSFTYH